jgi:hypothetical protein
MNIEPYSFAHACVEQNSIKDLESALTEEPDQGDLEAWDITAEEWVNHIKSALAALKEL